MIRTITEDFIKQKFAEFYRNNSYKIQQPELIGNREFGFFLFKKRFMIRHIRFRDIKDLRKFIELEVPAHIYYSSAYYEEPKESMEQKGWIGADLVFDIDADHIPTICKDEHYYWICVICGVSEKGKAPRMCPKCESRKFKEETWVCETCLEDAKIETIKLVDFLTIDFGFKNRNLKLFFSGQRGYHVIIDKEEVKKLDRVSRKEIVDYIKGTSLNVMSHGLTEVGHGKYRKIIGPEFHDPGWKGRIARGTYDLITGTTFQKIENLERKNKRALKTLVKHKKDLLKAWENKTAWESVKGIGLETWKRVAHYVIEQQAVKIDTVVTTDIHRLLRMPETLHGKTGLLKITIPPRNLEDFDPFRDAVAFKDGEKRVYIKHAYKFRIGETIYGPYKQQTVDLPLAPAMLLLCKRVATPVH